MNPWQQGSANNYGTAESFVNRSALFATSPSESFRSFACKINLATVAQGLERAVEEGSYSRSAFGTASGTVQSRFAFSAWTPKMASGNLQSLP